MRKIKNNKQKCKERINAIVRGKKDISRRESKERQGKKNEGNQDYLRTEKKISQRHTQKRGKTEFFKEIDENPALIFISHVNSVCSLGFLSLNHPSGEGCPLSDVAYFFLLWLSNRNAQVEILAFFLFFFVQWQIAVKSLSCMCDVLTLINACTTF